MDGRQLGEFLRVRRQSLLPEDVGIADKRPRRTVGLRREEVAERAGISCEWYVKLEQGGGVSPSLATVDALGRALMLDAVEVAHLRALAVSEARPSFQREEAPQPLVRIVESLVEPAYLTGQRFDIICLNPAAIALFGNFGEIEVGNRNVVHWLLTNPAARDLFGATWAEEARRVVHLFRATHDLWPGDPSFSELVAAVAAESDEFGKWWAEHEIGAPLSGLKRLRHPEFGIVPYEYATFQANDDPSLKLAIYARV